MKQTQTFLSTYTADVSGVCSALFELGGMTIMHDASGCNSTYNTHDEPRWYDTDSLVFISGLSEMEAIMGDDEKLIGDIVDAAEKLAPKFIAIAGTPIPMMTGCDIPAIAAEVESRTGIPSFGFQTNGMHSYVLGASEALAAYAERMVSSAVPKADVPTVNIIGATPLDFSVNGTVGDMKELLEVNGWKVQSVWAMGSSAEEIENSGKATVNLVVSSVGLEAAKVMNRRFNTPYVIGTPTGKEFSRHIFDALKRAETNGENIISFGEFKTAKDADIAIIGESVTSKSLAAAIWLEYGKIARVICPLEIEKGILSEGDSNACEEDDISSELKNSRVVIADPLYRPIVPQSCKFYELAHKGFSGRIYRNQIPNLVYKI